MGSAGFKLTYKDSSQTSLKIGLMLVETKSSNCFDSSAMARSAARGYLLRLNITQREASSRLDEECHSKLSSCGGTNLNRAYFYFACVYALQSTLPFSPHFRFGLMSGQKQNNPSIITCRALRLRHVGYARNNPFFLNLNP